MIINHEHRYVFVQVPSTASSAIGQELCDRYGGEPILNKHSHLAELTSATGGQYRGYFTFGTIRHPLDIMVARYFKLKINRRGYFTDPQAWAENGGFVTRRQRERFRFVQEMNADFPAYFLKYAPRLYEHRFFTGLLDRFDRILRYETLDPDFREALQQVGVDVQCEIPRVNVTRTDKRPFSEYYTPEIRERAVRSFGPYMRTWSYDFPETWDRPRPPWHVVLEYELGQRAGRFCRHRLGWSPADAIHERDRVRRWVRRSTRRWVQRRPS